MLYGRNNDLPVVSIIAMFHVAVENTTSSVYRGTPLCILCNENKLCSDRSVALNAYRPAPIELERFASN